MSCRPPVDSGSAAAEFVMVGGLLTLLFAGVVEAGLVLHTRNVLEAAAAEGARYAASTGSSELSGESRARELADSALSSVVVRDIPCVAHTEDRSGLLVRVVSCDGAMPVLFLPWGRLHIHVEGRALVEPGP